MKKSKQSYEEKIKKQREYAHGLVIAKHNNLKAIKYIKECKDSGLLFSHIIYENLLKILEGK